MKQNIPTACYDWCKNDGKCGVQAKKCSCPHPGSHENPQCSEGNESRIIITLCQVMARKNMQETKNNINIIHKMDEKKLFSYFYTNIVKWLKSKEIYLKSLDYLL